MLRLLGLLAVISGAASAETARFERYLERGEGEGYSLTCRPDCKIEKFMGDEIVTTKKIDAKIATEIVETFFSDLPKNEVKRLPLPDPAFPSGMVISWHAVNRSRYAEGALTRKAMEKGLEPPSLEAVLALEGRLMREVRK